MGTKSKEDNRLTPSRQLTLCPICKNPPVIVCTDVTAEKPEYKCFCSGSGVHVSVGDWKRTQQLAEEDWEIRVRDRTQPDLARPTNFDIIQNILANDIDAETFAEILASGDIREYLDIPSYSTKEELVTWLKSDQRKVLQLRFLGKDSWDRQVFEDQDGRIWKNIEIFTHRPAKLCTALHNAFEGEPDTPMDVMEAYKNTEIVFLPKRDVADSGKDSEDGQG